MTRLFSVYRTAPATQGLLIIDWLATSPKLGLTQKKIRSGYQQIYWILLICFTSACVVLTCFCREFVVLKKYLLSLMSCVEMVLQWVSGPVINSTITQIWLNDFWIHELVDCFCTWMTFHSERKDGRPLLYGFQRVS